MADTSYPYFAAGRDHNDELSDQHLAMEYRAQAAWWKAADALNEWLVGRANGTAPEQLPRSIQTALEALGTDLERQHA